MTNDYIPLSTRLGTRLKTGEPAEESPGQTKTKVTQWLRLLSLCVMFFVGQIGFAQSVATQTFSVNGYDQSNTQLIVNAADITVNGEDPILGVTISGFSSHYNSPTGSDGCPDWWDFDFEVSGGVADGTELIMVCGSAFVGMNVTDFSNIIITVWDADDWNDMVYFNLTLVVTYGILPDCSGTPDGGTASASPSSGGTGSIFTASAAGVSTGLGITYQWEYSTDGGDSWNDVSGATSASGNITAIGTYGVTQYRLRVYCEDSDETSYSTITTYETIPVINVPASGNNSITTCSGTVYDSGGPDGNYGNNQNGYTVIYPSGSGNLVQVSGTSGGENCCDWIRIFDGVGTGGTQLWAGNPGGGTIPLTTSTTGPLTVQFTSDVSATGFGFALTISCFTIPDCEGTPDGGTASASPSSGAAGSTFTASASGASFASGISYQWEYSTDGGDSWNDVSGATSTSSEITAIGTYGVTQYRLRVHCEDSNETSYSNVVTYTTELTYCTPTYANGCGFSGGDAITNVTLGTLNNSSGCAASPYYTFYNDVTVPDLQQGGDATVSITMGSDSTQWSAVWIDFNQNGTFEESEGFLAPANPGSNGTANITVSIPFDAVLGQTRMRVRGGNDSQLTTAQACGASSSGWGEAEDYIVNIIEAPTDTPDYYNLQWPASVTVLAGNSETVYAQVYEAGLTDVEPNIVGQAPGIEAWIGISPEGDNSNPDTWTNWTPATWNSGNISNNDEYQLAIGGDLPAGTYYYASRFRLNGGPYVYGGFVGAWDNNSGVLTVNPNPTQCAVYTAPANASEGVTIGTVALSWSSPVSGPAPTGYKVYFGTDSENLTLVTTTTGLTHNVSAPAYSTTYYWSVVPTSTIGDGDASGCAVWSFTTESSCGANFYDNGGSSANYTNSANVTTTFYPDNEGDVVSVEFTMFDVESGWDGLMIYDGPDTSAPVISSGSTFGRSTCPNGAWTGTGDFSAQGMTFTSTHPTGALTFVFTSDSSFNYAGWEATITCACVSQTWYADADGDGFGSDIVTVEACEQPAGYVAVGGDCDDNDATVYPGAAEICYDGKDNDCDGIIDNGCTPIVTIVDPTQCGVTLTSIDDYVYATAVPGANGYRFMIRDLVTDEVQYQDKNLRWFRIIHINNYAFDRAYEVSVAVRIGGVWQPFFGETCIVTTPIPYTQIQESQCGIQINNLNDILYADKVDFAIGYKFRVINTLEPEDVQEFENPLRTFKMSLLTNPKFNTVYTVEVAVKNRDGSYLPYGDACTITTPLFPATSLQESQCEDYPVSSNTEILYADTYPGATKYIFRLENASLSYAQEVIRPLRTITLNRFSGLVPGENYTVRVAIELYGVIGPWGKPCTIVTPGGDVDFTREETVVSDFGVVAYPNPFVDGFSLDVRSNSSSSVSVAVYDMTGRLLESRDIKVEDLSSQTIGYRYPSGVYNVVVTQDDEVRTVRVVKK